MRLDPRGHLPDVDASDNAWSAESGIRASGESRRRQAETAQEPSSENSGRTGKAAATNKQTEDGFYFVTDEAPEVTDGHRALLQNIAYPPQAKRRWIEGRVFLRVAVNADGTVERAKVIRGLGFGIDEEAQRTVRHARFEPGTLDGKPVPSMRTFAIQFQLD